MRTHLWLPRRRRDEGEKDRELGVSRHSLLYGMDKQQGPTVRHRELYPVITIMEKKRGRNAYLRVTDSLCCTAETNVTL